MRPRSELTHIHRARRLVWRLRPGDPVESVAGVAIIVLIFAVAGATYDVPTVLTRLAAIETLSLARNPEACAHEVWAVTGEFASSSACAPRESSPGRYATFVETPAAERAFAYALTTPTGEHRLGIWLAVGPGDSPATLSWLCGSSAVPPGLERLGADVTTVPSRHLPSTCRGVGSHAPPR